MFHGIPFTRPNQKFALLVDLGEKWIGGVKIKLSGLLGVVWAVYIGVDMVGNAFGRGRSLLQAGGGAAAVVGR